MNKNLVIEDVINGAELTLETVDKSISNRTCGCYAIFCEQSKKYYIGSSENCKARKGAHFADMRRGEHSNAGIRRDFKKYGASAFHFFILEQCEKEHLEEVERQWYNLIGKDRLYNFEREISRPKNKKQKQVKYGKHTKQHAILMLKQGETYDKVHDVTKIDKGYLRTLSFRTKRSETNDVSDVSENDFLVEKTEEISVSEVEQKEEKVSKLKLAVSSFVSFIHVHFGLMDLAFYVLNGTACFAMWNTAPGVVGASMATIYCLFSLDAILRVKRADMPIAAGAAANRVVFLEVIAAIFHFRLIDAYLWQNLDKLPFSVYQTAGSGVNDYKRMDGDVCINCYWQNGDWVHFIAGLMAFLMAAAACHAVFFAKQSAMEAAKK